MLIELDQIWHYFLNKFQNIFQSTNASFPLELADLITPITTENENEELIKIANYDDIHNTIKHMNSMKSPGPNRMSTGFDKRYWQTIKDDFVPNQTAFLEGWWINENVLIAQEILHIMNKSK